MCYSILKFQFGNDTGFANNFASYGTDEVRQIIKCSGSHSAGNTLSVDLVGTCGGIALENIDKAMAFVSFRWDRDTQHANTFRSWNITDTTTLEINVGQTGTLTTVNFEAIILEWNSTNVDVQHTTKSTPNGAGTTVTKPINSVDLSRSFIIESGHAHNAGETTIGSEEIDRIRLDSTTTWEIMVKLQCMSILTEMVT